MVLDSKSLFLNVMLDLKMSLLSRIAIVVSIEDGITNVVSILICEGKQSPHPKTNVNYGD